MEYFENFTSSNVAKIGFDNNNSILEVHFLNGSVYQYFDVPSHVWESFKNADSIGSYLAQHIKGQYRYSRI